MTALRWLKVHWFGTCLMVIMAISLFLIIKDEMKNTKTYQDSKISITPIGGGNIMIVLKNNVSAEGVYRSLIHYREEESESTK